ncbi:MAG: GTP pyrophosphokinase [Firmicutes bacterium HGW-Firmicutes-2]|jgi:putative GTP pyrophosphokinase|nr:MAG: GTP pyrophosphokinase [Firmicutes bacterium HGW-Firmicutes-2]
MEFHKILQMNIGNKHLDILKNTNFIENIQEFGVLQQLYRAAIKEVRTKLEILDEEFQVKYDHSPIHHIEYRLKSPQSIMDKLIKKDLEINTQNIWTNLSDVAGIRVICNYINDIDRIAAFLIQQDDVTLIRRNDYIESPKSNGYRSLHLIVAVPIFLSNSTEQVKVEVQIRTIAMDFWASLEHKLKYKTQDEVSEDLRGRLLDCANSITLLDLEMQSIYEGIKSDQDQ